MSAVSAQGGWWGSLRQRGGAARGDIAGGLTAAVVLLAIEGAYGLVAFSKFGPEQAQIGFMVGVFAAAVSSIVTVLAGARGPMLSGSSSALSLLFATLVATLAMDPRSLGPNGYPFPPLVLAFVALAVVLAGFLQLLLGVFRMARLIRYVPYPVHAGYMNGTAILMIGAMMPNILGLPIGTGITALQSVKPVAFLIALVAFLIAVRPLDLDAAHPRVHDRPRRGHAAAPRPLADAGGRLARPAVLAARVRVAAARRVAAHLEVPSRGVPRGQHPDRCCSSRWRWPSSPGCRPRSALRTSTR